MARFTTPEWLLTYKDAINASPAHKQAAVTWEGDLTYVIQAEPDKGFFEDVCIWMDLWHGECRDAKIVDIDAGEKAKFMITAPYSQWKDVVRGRLDPVKGMMQGKLKLRGDLPTIVQYVDAARELVNIAREITTEFPDEA